MGSDPGVTVGGGAILNVVSIVHRVESCCRDETIVSRVAYSINTATQIALGGLDDSNDKTLLLNRTNTFGLRHGRTLFCCSQQ